MEPLTYIVNLHERMFNEKITLKFVVIDLKKNGKSKSNNNSPNVLKKLMDFPLFVFEKLIFKPFNFIIFSHPCEYSLSNVLEKEMYFNWFFSALQLTVLSSSHSQCFCSAYTC